MIVHVDDLQWAETMLLDLLDHVVDLSRGAPILVLCTARPELFEERPGWGGGKLNATTVLLEPLAAADCELLLDQLGTDLAPTRVRGCSARARAIRCSWRRWRRWRASGDGGRPSDDRGAARRPARAALAVEDRELLERAAIEGEVFHREQCGALAG